MPAIGEGSKRIIVHGIAYLLQHSLTCCVVALWEGVHLSESFPRKSRRAEKTTNICCAWKHRNIKHPQQKGL
jgi:hypothetical protein